MYTAENMVYFVIDGQDQAFSSQIATSAGRLLNHVSLYPPEHKEPFLFTFSRSIHGKCVSSRLDYIIITKKQKQNIVIIRLIQVLLRSAC